MTPGAVGLCALLLVVFAASAPRLARVLPPRTATYLLVGGSVAGTASAAGVLALLAATAVAQLPPVAAAGRWSPVRLRSADPVPLWLAVGATAALLVPLGLGLRQVWRRAAALTRLHRAYRHLGGSGPVVVVDSERPDAFATPAGGGRIVVTRGLWRVLSPPERAALLAHEQAHLRHRHVWLVSAAEVCAAVNPLLRRVGRATGQAVERWADESAAGVVGDRVLVARTLARAALHMHAAGGPAGRVSAVGGEVPQRVRALLAPPPRARPALTVAATLLLVAGLACTVPVAARTDAFLDFAGAAPTAAAR